MPICFQSTVCVAPDGGKYEGEKREIRAETLPRACSNTSTPHLLSAVSLHQAEEWTESPKLCFVNIII